MAGGERIVARAELDASNMRRELDDLESAAKSMSKAMDIDIDPLSKASEGITTFESELSSLMRKFSRFREESERAFRAMAAGDKPATNMMKFEAASRKAFRAVDKVNKSIQATAAAASVLGDWKGPAGDDIRKQFLPSVSDMRHRGISQQIEMGEMRHAAFDKEMSLGDFDKLLKDDPEIERNRALFDKLDEQAKRRRERDHEKDRARENKEAKRQYDEKLKAAKEFDRKLKKVDDATLKWLKSKSKQVKAEARETSRELDKLDREIERIRKPGKDQQPQFNESDEGFAALQRLKQRLKSPEHMAGIGVGGPGPQVQKRFSALSGMADRVKNKLRSMGDAFEPFTSAAKKAGGAAKRFGGVAVRASKRTFDAFNKLSFSVWKIEQAFRLASDAGRQLGTALVEGEQIKNIGVAFEDTARKTGVSMKQLQQVTEGTIDKRTLSEMTTFASRSGLGAKEITRFADLARKIEVAGIKPAQEAFDRLVRGTAKQEREILDELSIHVEHMSLVMKKAADRAGKSVRELTQTERMEAYFEAVSEAGSAFDDAMDTEGRTDEVKKAQVSLNNAMDDFKVKLSEVASHSGILDEFGAGIELMSGALSSDAFKRISGQVFEGLKSVFSGIGEALESLAPVLTLVGPLLKLFGGNLKSIALQARPLIKILVALVMVGLRPLLKAIEYTSDVAAKITGLFSDDMRKGFEESSRAASEAHDMIGENLQGALDEAGESSADLAGETESLASSFDSASPAAAAFADHLAKVGSKAKSSAGEVDEAANKAAEAAERFKLAKQIVEGKVVETTEESKDVRKSESDLARREKMGEELEKKYRDLLSYVDEKGRIPEENRRAFEAARMRLQKYAGEKYAQGDLGGATYRHSKSITPDEAGMEGNTYLTIGEERVKGLESLARKSAKMAKRARGARYKLARAARENEETYDEAFSKVTGTGFGKKFKDFEIGTQEFSPQDVLDKYDIGPFSSRIAEGKGKEFRQAASLDPTTGEADKTRDKKVKEQSLKAVDELYKRAMPMADRIEELERKKKEDDYEEGETYKDVQAELRVAKKRYKALQPAITFYEAAAAAEVKDSGGGRSKREKEPDMILPELLPIASKGVGYGRGGVAGAQMGTARAADPAVQGAAVKDEVEALIRNVKGPIDEYRPQLEQIGEDFLSFNSELYDALAKADSADEAEALISHFQQSKRSIRAVKKWLPQKGEINAITNKMRDLISHKKDQIKAIREMQEVSREAASEAEKVSLSSFREQSLHDGEEKRFFDELDEWADGPEGVGMGYESIPEHYKKRGESYYRDMARIAADMKEVERDARSRREEIEKAFKAAGGEGNLDAKQARSDAMRRSDELKEAEMVALRRQQERVKSRSDREGARQWLEDKKAQMNAFGEATGGIIGEGIGTGLGEKLVFALNDAYKQTENWADKMSELLGSLLGKVGGALAALAKAEIMLMVGNPFAAAVAAASITAFASALAGLFQRSKGGESVKRRIDRELERDREKREAGFTVNINNQGMTVTNRRARELAELMAHEREYRMRGS